MDNIEESIEKIKKETADIETQTQTEDMIKDNKVNFEFEGIKYRVNRPTFEQKQIVNKERMKKFVFMLKDPEMLLEKDLIALYETRGINIKELDDLFNVAQKRREDLGEKLGKALVDKKDTAELEIYKKEIEKIIVEQNEILMRKSALLDSSIESQINVFVYTYLAYLTTDKYVHGADLGEGNKEPDPGWQLAWNSYDEFLKQPEGLVNKATWLATYVNKVDVLTT